MRGTRRHLVGLLGGAVLVMLGVGCAPQLTAPPRLIVASPGRGARLPVAPQTFELTFNRPLSEAGSWAEISREEHGGGVAIENVVDRRDPRRMRIRLMSPEAGEFRLRWHAVGRRSTQAVDGEQEFALYNETGDPPKLEVSRQAANVGDKVYLTGSGFAPGRTVRLTIGDDEQPLLTTDADLRGTFDVEARVPPTVAYGMQPVGAADRAGNTATAAVPVRWGGWPPLVAFTVGQAGPSSGEVTFSLSLRNRSDYLLERVRVSLDDPAGARFVGAQPGAEHRDATVRWELATLDRGVAGPFRVTYRVEGATATHAHIEFRHRRPAGCAGDECLPAFVSETTSDSTPIAPADYT